MSIDKETKQKVINETKVHDTDTGSPEVQVGIITERIENLSQHLKVNKKDEHSRKGLLGLVSKRRKHLKYLEKKNTSRYQSLLEKLGLKK